MNRKTLCTALTLAATLAVATGVNATPQICPIVSPENWMSAEKAEGLAREMGYDDIAFVQPEGGCWVAFAKKEGFRHEIYFHPATGEVVRTEIK